MIVVSPNGPRDSAASEANSLDELDAVTGERLLAALEEQPTDSRQLYFEWERQQWEAGAVDLRRDAEEWVRLPLAQQQTALSLMSCWVRDGRRVQELTVVLADAVVTEQDQVFMTTQLADAARHSVAYDRFFGEVVSTAGGSAGDRHKMDTTALDAVLARTEQTARDAPVASNSVALCSALFSNNLVVEGVLAPVAQACLVDSLSDWGALSGLRMILAASFRDHVRHAAFGVTYLRRELDADAAKVTLLEPHIRRSVQDVRDILSGADSASNGFEGIAVDRNELGSRLMDCLARRLQDIGVELP